MAKDHKDAPAIAVASMAKLKGKISVNISGVYFKFEILGEKSKIPGLLPIVSNKVSIEFNLSQKLYSFILVRAAPDTHPEALTRVVHGVRYRLIN